MSTSDTPKLVKRPSSGESSSVDSTVTKKQKKPSPNTIKVPAEIYLQVLQSGRPGVGRCLFLFTSNERYLFNCPEGTARLAAEHGIKATKVQHVFCTHASWTNLGGLPGLFYTLRDAGHGQVCVHGPTNAEMIVETMKPYNDTTSIIDVVGLDYEQHPVYEDDGIKITSIPIFGSSSVEMSESDRLSQDSDLSYDSVLESQDSSNYESLGEFDENEAAEKIAQLFRSISGGSTKAARTSADTDSSCEDHQLTVEPELRRDMAVAYLCEPKTKPGRISMEKCLEVGVPKGPLVGKLQRDESVTLPDGRVIKPADVKEAAILSPTFLVVECPSIDMISAFINNPLLKCLKEGVSDHRITLIAHLSPEAVASHDDYQKWLRGFSSLDGNKATQQEQQKHIRHLFLNEACPFLPHSEAVFAQQHRLGLVHESIFPTLPSHVNAVQVREIDAAVDIPDTEACDVRRHRSSVHAVPLLKFHIRPPIGFDRSACLRLNRDDVLTIARSLPGFDDVNVATKKQLESLYLAKDHISRYPEVIFLGTSSATPAKTRNLSAIWLNLDDETSLLCDCGEGTLGQLVELFGPEEANRMLMKLKFVFISHLHADHHAGVCSIILARREAFKAEGRKHPRLSLLASAPLFTMHNVFSSIVEPIGSLCRRIPTRSITPCVSIENGTSGKDFTKEGIAKVLAETGLSSIELVKVNHPAIAYGIVMTTGGSAPKKIVYSGDTTPCEELVEAGKNADLLIHEATMENDLEEDALKKRHCTVRQAVDVAKAMGAKHTILTHFSCRYSRIPNISESDLDGSIGIAYDFMRIRFGELDIVPRLVPLLRAVFWDYFQDVLDKTGKRQQRKELEAQQEQNNQNAGLSTSLMNQLL